VFGGPAEGADIEPGSRPQDVKGPKQMKTRRIIIYAVILAVISALACGGYWAYTYMADQYCWKCTTGQYYERASVLIQSDDEASRKKGIGFLKSAAAGENIDALIILGELYMESFPQTWCRHFPDMIDALRLHTPPDPPMALSFFKRLADILSSEIGQYADMQYNLGLLAKAGVMTGPAFEGMAYKWFEISAAQGNVYAMDQLGLHYDASGEYGTAAKLFKQAASSGRVPDSAVMMGDYYQYGKGVDQDFQQAMLMYRQALSILNEAGLGISPQTIHDLSDKAAQRLAVVQQKVAQLPKGAAIKISYAIRGSVNQYSVHVPDSAGQLIGRVENQKGTVRAWLTGQMQAGSDALIGNAASMNDGLIWILNTYAKTKHGSDKRFVFIMTK